MCIICVSPRKVRQPSLATIKTMFLRNPHGAGYMFARDGIVHISKGYMDVESYIEALRREHFTAKDAVVYHFRISTQAGVNPAMTHPFPLSNKLAHMKALQGVQRHGAVHRRLPLRNHPLLGGPEGRGCAEAGAPAGGLEAGHHGRQRIHRHGRELHQREGDSVLQRQLPENQSARLVTPVASPVRLTRPGGGSAPSGTGPKRSVIESVAESRTLLHQGGKYDD